MICSFSLIGFMFPYKRIIEFRRKHIITGIQLRKVPLFCVILVLFLFFLYFIIVITHVIAMHTILVSIFQNIGYKLSYIFVLSDRPSDSHA